MSADPDRDTACPKADKQVAGTGLAEGDTCHEVTEEKRKKPPRSVRFPEENQLVTKYFEPANPWQDVPTTSRAQLAAEYLESCRRHNTTPIESVLQQIRELPEASIGGGTRAARLALTACSLAGAAPADALEALLRKVQFRRLEIQHCEVDDEGAEAIFDMIEYYESANVVCISGPRQFGIRGWQAACRMIKKSAELTEIEVCESELCSSHAPVLMRALRPHTCRLRALCLQRAALQGEPLLCLVIALKSNTSIRELRLPDNQLSPSDAQQLASVLRLNLHIQLLDLSNNEIQDTGAGYIADAIVEQAAQTPPSAATSPLSPQHYPLGGYETRLGLAFLVLWNNQLTRNCAPHLSKALRASLSLCVVNIGRNAVGGSCVRALRGGALVSLGLQGAKLGPRAAAPLADLLAEGTKLQRLDLRDNRLGVDGLRAIYNAMKDNTTVTQIDLDDPEELPEDESSESVAQLTRDIEALCRRNEPPATEPERRVHRKISLTCHTAFTKPASNPTPPLAAPEPTRRGPRLRSPAPSPAPSPVPHNHHQSRFSVTRVTPEREQPTEGASPTPPRPNYCLTPSRFKVVQVAEPPQIQVHPAERKRTPSRFSVTRNYDAIYNPSPTGSPRASPSPGASPVPSASPVPGALPSPGASPVPGASPSPGASPTPVSLSSLFNDTRGVFNDMPKGVSSDTVMSDKLTGVFSETTAEALSNTLKGVSSDASTGVGVKSAGMLSNTPKGVSNDPSIGVCDKSAGIISETTVTAGVLNDIPKGVFSDAPKGVLSDASAKVFSEKTAEVSDKLTGLYSDTTKGVSINTSIGVIDKSIGMTDKLTGVNDKTTFTDTLAAVSSDAPVLISDLQMLVASSISSTTISNISSTIGMFTTSPTVGIFSTPTVIASPTPALSLVLTSGPLTVTPTKEMLTNVTPVQEIGAINPNIIPAVINVSSNTMPDMPTQRVQTEAIIRPGFVTEDKIVPTAVPNVSPALECVPNLSLTQESINQYIDMISNSSTDQFVSKTDSHVPIIELLDESSNTPKLVETKPVFSIGMTPVVLKNDAVKAESKYDVNRQILSGTPSIITMTGDTISGTSLVTLTGTISSGNLTESNVKDTDSLITFKENTDIVFSKDSELNLTRVEPMISFTEIEPPNWSNTSAASNPINIDRSRFESRFGPAVVPQNEFVKAVPNSRFSISPIPDKFDVSPQNDKPKEEIARPVAIGSQTNIAAPSLTYTKPIANAEADILTKIAEITEKVGPKVVETEPNDTPKPIDLIKDETMQYIDENIIIDTMPSINRDVIRETNAPINIESIPIDVSSKNSRKIDESVDKSTTEKVKPQIFEAQKTVLTDSTNLPKLSEQTKTEGPCIDVKNIPTVDPKHIGTGVPVKEVIKNPVVDKIGLKPVANDDVKHLESKQEVSKDGKPTENVKSQPEVFVTNILEDNTADSRITHCEKDKSDAKISDKSDDNVKNKTYSDVVKSDPKYKDKSEQLTHKEEISDSVVKTETKLVKDSVEMSDADKIDVHIEVKVKKESVQDAAKVNNDQNKDFVNIDDILVKKEGRTMKQIEAITEDLGNLIQEMKDISVKSRKIRSDCTVDIVNLDTNKVPGNLNRDVVLKKNKSESSLDSPDLEVSRLMNKKMIGSPFCDSSSSLEISGSSMESLNAMENQHGLSCHVIPKQVVIQESVESDTELDRRKDVALSTESSVESTSDVTPVNAGNLLNMSVSSNESVSPIIFGKKKKLHDSLSSLEASMSSLDSGRQEKVMVTSADSGIEYSLQNPSENKEDNSSNEGTLTHNSSLKETAKKIDQETLTSSPKRASSLLDVPALKTKGLDRIRKISLVGPSSSFQLPRVETEKEKPSHLEKLLSLFQHPTSLFSRSQSDDERKSASNTPPRKDSSLTSSFWSWGSAMEKEKEEKEDSSEATDSTLSERVQVSFVDESFSKKLDSKTPSTDTDNTLSEFQSFPTQTSVDSKVTDETTDEIVQRCLDLSLKGEAGSNGNRNAPRAGDTDLSEPNDLNRNYEVSDTNKNDVDENKTENIVKIDKDEAKLEPIRPRSFAAVLKSSGSENSLDKQPSPDSGQSVDKLSSKVIRGIKENISPENTLTSSMTNTKTLALELTERQVKTQPVVNTVWEVPLLDKTELKTDDVKTHSDLAPIATIDETCDEAADNTVNIQLNYIDDVKTDEKVATEKVPQTKKEGSEVSRDLENVDLGKDALSYLIYESQDFEPDLDQAVAARAQVKEGSLAEELKEAAIKELQDLSPELVIDEAIEPEVFSSKEIIALKSSPVIPERAKLIKSNSLEDLSQREETEKSPKIKTIAFKIPETTSPRDIPERRPKLRTMSGSSPKSLPESLNKPSPLTKMDQSMKKRKKVSSLGKMARDSLLALNMSEDEIAEYRRSYATSAESLRSLESVSEDANSQSGTSIDSRCRFCLRTSQESLMSLDSITEDCKCGSDSDKAARSVR